MNPLSSNFLIINAIRIVLVIALFTLNCGGTDEESIYPLEQNVIRFEINDERLIDLTHQISSSNRDATKFLLQWLKENAALPFDKNWQGSYRPIFIVRFWVRGEREPRRFPFDPEWRDTKGAVHKLTDTLFTTLFAEVLKAAQYKGPK